MIKGINHTGIVVRNLDASIQFYCEVLGFELIRKIERPGGPISQVVGYGDAHLLAAHLSIGNVMLEFIEYCNPEVLERYTQERAVIGGTHVAFDVDDIHSTYQKLLDKGANKLNPPERVASDKIVCYMQDPDGNWIELIETSDAENRH